MVPSNKQALEALSGLVTIYGKFKVCYMPNASWYERLVSYTYHYTPPKSKAGGGAVRLVE